MSEPTRTKVLVVGGGPGGYIAAIRARQFSLDCVPVEADRLGGTCLTRGCIPSNALIHAAAKLEAISNCVGAGTCGISLREPLSLDLAETVRWKDSIVSKLNQGVAGLLRRAKVRVLHGTARMRNGKTCEVVDGPDSGTVIRAEHVILATGFVPAETFALPFGGPVISSTEALSLSEFPAHLVVIGAGYIGLELGIAYRKFGARITVIEAAERIPPAYDEDLTQPVKRWLQQAGVALHLGAKVIGLRETADGATLRLQPAEGECEISADKILYGPIRTLAACEAAGLRLAHADAKHVDLPSGTRHRLTCTAKLPRAARGKKGLLSRVSDCCRIPFSRSKNIPFSRSKNIPFSRSKSRQFALEEGPGMNINTLCALRDPTQVHLTYVGRRILGCLAD